MTITIREQWQAEIVARDALKAKCLTSYVAKLLYPDVDGEYARLERLRAEGGEIVARIAEAARHEGDACSRALDEWNARKPAVVDARTALQRSQGYEVPTVMHGQPV